MPRNIYLSKENIPKIAEVREIETNIPTYEEFIKNYQVDQEANESYENELSSYSDVGIVKGYGPCYVCYKDTQWTSLYMPCPAADCRNIHTSYWNHTPGCGSRLEISNKAKIRCSGCSFNCDLKDYYFNCSMHRGDYRAMDRRSINKSISIILGMNNVSEVMVDLSAYMTSHR